MKGEAGIVAGLGASGLGGDDLGGSDLDSPATGEIIAWPGICSQVDASWQGPLLGAVRVWAMAAMAGLCPLRIISSRLVADGLAGWVVPLDRFMHTLCLAAARPLRIAPPDHAGRLTDEARLLTALQAVQSRRTGVAREQLCALVSPDCIDQVLHAALLLGAALGAGPSAKETHQTLQSPAIQGLSAAPGP